MFIDSIHSLSTREMNVFDFILNNLELVSSMSIKELSLKLGITEYSINKFCKKINVDTFENLTEILKEIVKSFSECSNSIFSNSIKDISNFTEKLNTLQLSQIGEIICISKNVVILFSNHSKLIASYLKEGLISLNINVKTTSSLRQLSKIKDIDLIIYISIGCSEMELNSPFENFSNKVTITISDRVTKKAHDNSSIFVHIPINKSFKNFNVNCTGLCFTYIDLILSKMIEINNK